MSLFKSGGYCCLLALSAVLLVVSQAQAQTQPVAYPTKTTEYYDAEGGKLPSAEGADHRVETTYTDSVIASVRSFYSSGKLKSVRAYGHLRLGILNGVTTTWYESGQMHTKQDFLAGKRHGELLVYYPDGKVRRRDQFERDVRTAGECLGPDGQPVAYFEYEQMPVYPDGIGDNAALVRAVMLNTRYPKEALKAGLSARIFVTFQVSREGQVQNIQVKPGSSPLVKPKYAPALASLEAAAIESVRQLKTFVPGKQDGEPVTVGYTVPVTFLIQ